MANSAQSRKRARQSENRRQHKAGQRATFRTFIKKVFAAIKAGNKDDAQAALKNAACMIDKTAQKGLIHKNKAARHKSRLNTRVQTM